MSLEIRFRTYSATLRLQDAFVLEISIRLIFIKTMYYNYNYSLRELGPKMTTKIRLCYDFPSNWPKVL